MLLPLIAACAWPGVAAPAPPASQAASAPAPAQGPVLAFKPPAAEPEPFGEHDDFPWLPALPGSVLADAEHADEGLDVTTLDDAEPRIVGALRMTRRYVAPAALGAEAIARAYAAALRNAGWVVTMQQPQRASGDALVIAHFAATGRDVWTRVVAGAGRYELDATDAGLGIAQAFATGCSLVANGIAFGIDDASLLPGSEATLTSLLHMLKAHSGLRIEVVAYTDGRDADGDHAANLALSARRAEAVKKWFLQHHFDGDRIATRGLGDAAPLRPSDSDENRARNRRIEIRKAGCR